MTEKERNGEAFWSADALPESPRTGPIAETVTAEEEEDSKEQIGFINQYALIRELGSGSSGSVWLALNEENEKLYAIKIMSKQGKKRRVSISKLPKRRDFSLVAGMDREIAIMKKLDHPNVVNLWEVINDPAIDRLYLVFEYVPNGSLKDIYDNRRLTESQTLRYFRQIILAMEYLHSQGVCHGDIKPENLFVTAEDTIKVGDFGVAFLQSEKFTKKMAGMGTPLYTAPEVLQRSSSPSTSIPGEDKMFSPVLADIWALGVTLYEMVFGKCPFVGESLFSTYTMIKNDPVEFPSDQEISSAIHDFLSRILVKDPNHRMSIQEMKAHAWITKDGTDPMPENSTGMIDPSVEEVETAVKSNDLDEGISDELSDME